MALRKVVMPCGRLYINEGLIEETVIFRGKTFTLKPKQVKFVGDEGTGSLLQYLHYPEFWEHRKELLQAMEVDRRAVILVDLSHADRFGDNIMATIIPKAYKESYGEAAIIDVLVNERCASVWENNPHIRSILFEKPDGVKYDVVVGADKIQFKFDSEDNCTATILKRLGIHSVNMTPVYVVTEEERTWAREYMGRNCPDFARNNLPFVAVQMRSSARVRTYQHADELVKFFKKDGWGVILLDGELTFRQAAAVMEQCHFVVAPDSAMLHLAGALKKRVFGLFGHTGGAQTVENYEKAVVIKGACPDGKQPCWWSVPCVEGKSYTEKEQNGFAKCLSAIRPDEITYSIKQELEKTRKVFVGMLTWNLLTWTKYALSSIRSKHDYQIFVVDNESTDGTQDYLKSVGVEFVVKKCSVPQAENTLFRRFLESDCKYFILLNNDVVLRHDTIDNLVACAEQTGAWGVMSQDVHTGEPSDISSRELPKYKVDEIVDIPVGAYSCTLFTRHCIETVGFDDEWFTPRYIHDNDYTLRLRLAGGRFVKCHNAMYFHLEGGVWAANAEENLHRDLNWKKNIAYYYEKWGILPHDRQDLNKLGDEWKRPKLVEKIDELLKTKKQLNVVVHRRQGGYGDILYVSIVGRELKKKYSDRVKVYYNVDERYVPLISRYPYISGVNWNGTPDASVDLTEIDFRVEWNEIATTGGIQSTRTLLHLNVCGLTTDNPKMDYFLLPGEKAYAQGVWKSMKGNKKVVVVPAGSNKLKNWHGMAEVTKRLREQGHRVVWNDNTVTLAQIGAIISEADLVISPDTGPQVVACALEVPVITVFSNRNHKPFELMFPTMIPLRGNCPYSEAGYCDYKMLCHPSAEGPYLGKENSIPGGEPECFRNLGVDTVMAASEEILK